jgi:hypothetical protein
MQVLVQLGKSRACGWHGQTEPMGSAWRRRRPKRCGCRYQFHQGLIAHGEHLTSRCQSWIDDMVRSTG